MKPEVLILFSRKDCCLCETLEKKLSAICLTSLNPPIVLSIVDVDSKEVSNNIKEKYTNQVPVLVLDSDKLLRKIELPRVPPRLKEDFLLSWIQKNLNIFFRLS
tara:strand:- start:760 stop:1071 length:312 start_codon:yes stop_codon:yes gene_type:complete